MKVKCSHLLNSSLSFICEKETMVLVTLVPMFAPMIIGIAVFTGTLAATNPTMIEVEVDDDLELKFSKVLYQYQILISMQIGVGHRECVSGIYSIWN